MKFFTINEANIPMIGLGTYKIKGYEACFQVVDFALQLGYRLFDTAQVYKNESDLGKCFEILLPKYNLKREDIFIITKISTANQGEKCTESVRTSLASLRTNYLDLVLVHWPGVKGVKLDDVRNTEIRKSTYKQLEKLYFDKILRFIGVSNYTLRHLNDLFSYALVKPHLLQSEYHPFLQQTELVEFCKANSIAFQAYSSLGTSDKNLTSKLLDNKVICSVAEKYSKKSAQILLKWALDQNIGVIPKSENFEHLKENISIFDFTLEKTDIDKINMLNQNLHFCWNSDNVT